jgi:hypothetical protein
MIKFCTECSQADFDVAERFSAGELCEGHAEILVETRECFDFVIAVVALHATMKVVAWRKVHKLRKDRSSVVHGLLLVQSDP